MNKRQTFHVEFNLNSAAERDAANAPRPRPRQIRSRSLKVEGRHYLAIDAHSLLETTEDLSRPGHPY